MGTKELNILFEDSHILVCHKPAGIATQSKKIGSPDMVSILKNHLAVSSSQTNAKKEPYLAVIHRLDQPVEGIMVFAKTPFAAKELNKELTSHGFGKYYRALVEKTPENPEGHLENYMVKDGRTNTSRICKKDTPGAKIAKLDYKTVTGEPFYFSSCNKQPSPNVNTKDTNSPGCELDIHLDTGRHHQIRVQLAGIGCPIVGDNKYNPTAIEHHRGGFVPLKLCSYQLEFTHPKTRKKMCFSLLEK